MKCWVCKRQARGYGHADCRFKRGDPRRYPLNWVFCSPRCQAAFAALYGNWQARQGGHSMSLSEMERKARHACLKAFGQAAGQIGFDKPLGDYSEAQALAVIDAIVTRYSEAMVEHHEAVKQPPVRGARYADFDDDIPF